MGRPAFDPYTFERNSEEQDGYLFLMYEKYAFNEQLSSYYCLNKFLGHLTRNS